MTDLPIDWDGPTERPDACGPRCVGVTCCGAGWSPRGDCPCMGEADHSDCPEVVEIVGRDGRRSDISVWVRDPSTGCVAAVSEHLSAAERMDSLSVLLAREGETRSYVVATGPQDACEAAAHDVSPALALALVAYARATCDQDAYALYAQAPRVRELVQALLARHRGLRLVGRP